MARVTQLAVAPAGSDKVIDKTKKALSRQAGKTKQVLTIQAKKTKVVLSRHADKIAKSADKHETLINKVTYSVGVLAFGLFFFLLGARPQDIPYMYCVFFITVIPLRWIYYRSRKWHYFLLDFCYYANLIFMVLLLRYPHSEKLFMVSFAFAEGPLAWAIIVWRCSLVFNSVDKIISVLIHLLPGTVFYIVRWWEPSNRASSTPHAAWPVIEDEQTVWTFLFVVPLVAYCVWQVLYLLVVEVLRKQRLVNDPEVLTSYRELSRKAARANNVWWRASGLLGHSRRGEMYCVLQACFTVATMALTVPIFKSYKLHSAFQVCKVAAAIWNGGSFLFEVMPKQAKAKELKKPGDAVKTEKPGAVDSLETSKSRAVKAVAAAATAAVARRTPLGPIENLQHVTKDRDDEDDVSFADGLIVEWREDDEMEHEAENDEAENDEAEIESDDESELDASENTGEVTGEGNARGVYRRKVGGCASTVGSAQGIIWSASGPLDSMRYGRSDDAVTCA